MDLFDGVMRWGAVRCGAVEDGGWRIYTKGLVLALKGWSLAKVAC